MLTPRRRVAGWGLLAGIVAAIGAGAAHAAAPVANDDAYETARGVQLVVPAPGVLADDTADAGKTLTAAVITPPLYGTLVLESTGAFSYTPNPSFYGTDSFSYRANDGTDDSNDAVVGLTVTVQEPPPYGGPGGGGGGGGYGGGAPSPATLLLLALAALYPRGLKFSKRRAISP